MRTLDSTLRAAFDAFKGFADETEPVLTMLDERSGDGDFGANLHDGLEIASARAQDMGGNDTWDVLARVFLDEVGGTSGPLLGLLFQQVHNAATTSPDAAQVFGNGGRAGLRAIQRVGEAHVGDRTLVDSLEPGVAALLDSGDIAAGVRAAVEGAISTRELVARRGRASYVGERAVGYADPGAVAVALLFAAVGRAAGVAVDHDIERLIREATRGGDDAPADSAQRNSIGGGDGDGLEGDGRDAESYVASASSAQAILDRLPLEGRAAMLEALANALYRSKDELVAIAQAETHLSRARLLGEVLRTSFQLRLFAGLVRDGDFLDVRIDHVDSTWPVAPRPDLRRSQRPLGPVLVFAASNFPFAFSVLGGDTASALAAGNAVIVKAHPGHPRLSRRTAEIAANAIELAGAPTGTLTLIEGDTLGVTVLRDPRIKAAAFTGSVAGGRVLFDIAQARPQPIPFFGELGSNNPVFVTPSADADAAMEIAQGFVASVTLGAGQFCTKPGTLLVPSQSRVEAALRRIALPAPSALLNERITSGFHTRLRELINAPKVEILRSDADPFDVIPAPVLLRVPGAEVLRDPDLYLGECFGPASLVVEYGSALEMLELARVFEGQLTATIFGDESDSLQELLAILVDRAGRVLWRQWPTGVSVTHAQQHGGPYPASTAPQSTSVGTAAITRFLRPVAMQGFPQELLPLELRDVPA